MIAGAPEPPPFNRLGLAEPRSPVVLAVPHAGRDYPAALLAASRLGRERLETLEDRYADRLIDTAVAQGASAIVARRARAWIDLNRDEREIAPAMLDPLPRGPLLATAKVRGGLGLIPRRLAGGGDVYRQRLAPSDIEARIADDHRPWHAALADMLAAAHARFGVAVLLDIHSMPPTPGASAIVLGDRNGRSSAPRFLERIEAEAATADLTTARNLPYPGGHTVEQHGKPAIEVHAIQLEVVRSLYLAPGLRTPSAGLTRIARFVAAAVAALADEALSSPRTLLAAE